MLINDSRFRVEVDWDSTSPNPETAIWRGQHTCVSELFAYDEALPNNPGDIIVRHQMKPKHFSVLRKAYISFCCSGFPHSVVAQITRHQDSAHLVESNRYTGLRFVKVALHEISPEDVFYMRPVGRHGSRNGIYERTAEMNERRWLHIRQACLIYNDEIKAGVPFEDARDIMPYGFRQNFDISGDLQAVFHWLDQRSLADSQAEIRVLAEMVMQHLESWCPTIAKWYRDNRFGRNLLSP